MWVTTLRENIFTFAVPYILFVEMGEESKDSVSDGPVWKGLAGEHRWR
jgi:hypothetical protein